MQLDRVETQEEVLRQIWRADAVRLFLSHRSAHKVAARQLADALNPYGITTCIAHDVIRPMADWQSVIELALTSADVLLAFVTDDFKDGWWTNHEVGFAIGRNLPVIPLALEATSPGGFMAAIQSVPGQLESIEATAPQVYKAMLAIRSLRTALQGRQIEAFVGARDFREAIDRFEWLQQNVSSLNDEEFTQIQEGFSSNSQLYSCYYLRTQKARLSAFLFRVTGRRVKLAEQEIVVIS
jgi:hypothetical protein